MALAHSPLAILPSRGMWPVVAWGLISLLMAGCGGKVTQETTTTKLLANGWMSFRLGEFDRATELFEFAEKQSVSGSTEFLDSLMGQASIWNTRQDKRDAARAEKLYSRIIELAPGSPHAAWASLDQVRITHLTRADQPIDYPSLAKRYRQVTRDYPGTPAAEEAFLLALTLEEFPSDPARLRSLVGEYQTFLSRHPETRFKGAVYGSLARLYDALGLYGEKLEALLRALKFREMDRLNPNEQNVYHYWNIAVTAEFDAGNFTVARQYYGKLLEEYPSDLLVFRAREALTRMDRVEADLKLGRPLPASLTTSPVGSGGRR